ncbi:MAG: FecR domain-containing protein [Saprospiraceae bacterium]|nr:FecR domain-containing protein [Saprospiraceae bacterium]MCB9318550.1 FecR domain-containing protein [Lewinellaceae bacterium]
MNQDIYNWTKKFHQGQLSESEWKQLMQAMEDDPALADAFYSVLTLLQGEEKIPPEVDVRKALDKHLIREQPGKRPIRHFMSRHWWKIAAMIIPILLVLKALWPTSPETPALVSTIRADSVQLDVVLPDGSQVVLAPFSNITWQENFKVRDVTIAGEAFFTVQRDSLHPFTVQAGTSSVRVLGTAFSVRAFESSPIQVEVLHGRVAVRRETTANTVILTAMESTVWDEQQGSWSTSEMTDEGDLAWATRVWKIDQQKLEDIIPGLERMYGIDLELANPALRHCRVSATLDHKTQEEMLEILKLILQVDITYQSGKIYLDGPGC